jgi:FkbM family methyltransferase
MKITKYLPKNLRQKLIYIKYYYFNGFANISFSQEGEDLVLKRIFDISRKGFYVDVGAHHPFRFSNTHIFYKNGWNGINIDAMPGSMKLFDRFRKRDINLELAVGGRKQEMEYFIFNETALNGFSQDLSKSRDGLREEYFIESKIKLDFVPLSEIFDKYLTKDQQIDFLSIDVEGWDSEVLKSNDWEKYRPKVILLEILKIDFFNLEKSEEVIYLSGKDYVPFAKTFNTVFFRENNIV